jgi:hypothetical protein
MLPLLPMYMFTPSSTCATRGLRSNEIPSQWSHFRCIQTMTWTKVPSRVCFIRFQKTGIFSNLLFPVPGDQGQRQLYIFYLCKKASPTRLLLTAWEMISLHCFLLFAFLENKLMLHLSKISLSRFLFFSFQ